MRANHVLTSYTANIVEGLQLRAGGPAVLPGLRAGVREGLARLIVNIINIIITVIITITIIMFNKLHSNNRNSSIDDSTTRTNYQAILMLIGLAQALPRALRGLRVLEANKKHGKQTKNINKQQTEQNQQS